MNLEDLEKIADNAIARWNDPKMPTIRGVPKFSIGHPRDDIEILPGLRAEVLGYKSERKMYILLFDAQEVKKAIARYKAEF